MTSKTKYFVKNGLTIKGDTLSLDGSKNLQIGDYYQGGIIFYLKRDSFNVQHGKVLSLKIDATRIIWGNNNQTVPNSGGIFNGRKNCDDGISFFQGLYVTAMKESLNSTQQGYNDWYLPSVTEAKIIANNLYAINKGFALNGGDEFNPSEKIWTSTQYNSFYAYSLGLLESSVILESKNSTNNLIVRSIRDF